MFPIVIFVEYSPYAQTGILIFMHFNLKQSIDQLVFGQVRLKSFIFPLVLVTNRYKNCISWKYYMLFLALFDAFRLFLKIVPETVNERFI